MISKVSCLLRSKDTKRRLQILLSVCILMLCYVMCFHGIWAADATKTMVNAIVKVLCNLVIVVGVIFAAVGFVKIVLAYANENGPEQQKAAMMLAVGVVLVALGKTSFFGIDFASMMSLKS